MPLRHLAALLLIPLLCGTARADDKKPTAAPAPKITYADHILPLLRQKCGTCHNPDKKSGGLNLMNFTALMEGGGSGKSVEPGDPDASSLYLLVAHKEQPNMPPKSAKLPD